MLEVFLLLDILELEGLDDVTPFCTLLIHITCLDNWVGEIIWQERVVQGIRVWHGALPSRSSFLFVVWSTVGGITFLRSLSLMLLRLLQLLRVRILQPPIEFPES